MKDPLLTAIDDIPVSDIVKKHYKKCMLEGGLCRRGIEFAVKILTQKPRKI